MIVTAPGIHICAAVTHVIEAKAMTDLVGNHLLVTRRSEAARSVINDYKQGRCGGPTRAVVSVGASKPRPTETESAAAAAEIGDVIARVVKHDDVCTTRRIIVEFAGFAR